MIRVLAAVIALAVSSACSAPPPAPPPAAVAVPADPAAEAVAINARLFGCDRPPQAPVAAPKIHALADGARVLQAPCGVGAYQEYSRFFVLRDGEPPELLSFTDYEDGAWLGVIEVATAELDAQTGVLTTWTKSAGHGGCGSQGVHQWNGLRFGLVTMRARSCADVPDDPTAALDYPIVWEAVGP